MLGAFTFGSIGAEQRNIRESKIKREDKYKNRFRIHIQHANPGYFLENQGGLIMIQPCNEINSSLLRRTRL